MEKHETAKQYIRKLFPYLAFAAALAASWVVAEMQFRQKVSKIYFYKEIITVTLHENDFAVKAEYFYRNLTTEDVSLKALAPFPLDRNMEFPESIKLTDDDRIPVMWDRNGSRIDFYLFFKPNEEKKLTLEYAQKVKEPKGAYILITTKPWRRPIGEGYYYLYMPSDFSLAESSYPVEPTMSDRPGEKKYYFEKKEFMPEFDWKFGWVREK